MCDRQTTKKYVSRPGPSYPANDPACRMNSKRGNDGRMYKSKRASNGIFRWKLVSAKKRSPKKNPSGAVGTQSRATKTAHGVNGTWDSAENELNTKGRKK